MSDEGSVGGRPKVSPNCGQESIEALFSQITSGARKFVLKNGCQLKPNTVTLYRANQSSRLYPMFEQTHDSVFTYGLVIILSCATGHASRERY